MTSDSKTPGNVADTATQPRMIDLGEVSVLGVFGSQTEPKALVRMPSGKTIRVETGSETDAGRVAGIDERGIVLEKAGRTRRITMPDGRLVSSPRPHARASTEGA